MTGRCCVFYDCEKWKCGCGHCLYRNSYPKSLIDFSHHYWKLKRNIVEKYNESFIFVCPSIWLSTLMKKTFPNADIRTVNNGIDQSIFLKEKKPLEYVLKVANGRMIAGAIAYNLSISKGYDDYIKIAEHPLMKDILFVILGASIHSDYEQIKDNVLLIKKTNDKKTISSFYSSLNVFLDFTKSDNYPTTHLEALTCGVPIITYNVGGAAETIIQKTNGFSVPFRNLNLAVEAILSIKNNPLNGEKIIFESKRFNKNQMESSYMSIYKSILKDV